MQYSEVLQILFVCPMRPEVEAKIQNLLLRKTASACQHKGINGFLLQQGDRFVGLLEGPDKKVLAQVETLVRKPFLQGIIPLRERRINRAEWSDWFTGGRHLSELPPELIAQTAGLAQFIAHELNARPD